MTCLKNRASESSIQNDMTPQQAIPIIEKTIAGERHEHYKYTIEVADMCYQMMTGENQQSALRKFRSEETKDQIEQREKLFLSPTRGFLSPVKNVFEKIRFLDSEAVNRWSKLSDVKQRMLDNALKNTWENQRLIDYLYDVELFYNFYDPNAFIVCEERRERDDENAVKDVQIYPLEVTSIQAVNYKIQQGKVIWFVAEFKDFEVLVSDPSKKKDISKFYMYAPGTAIAYIEYHETIPQGTQRLTEIKVGSDVRKFSVQEFVTGTVEAPVMRVGSYLDPKTRNETFIPPYWEAILDLEMGIRLKSMHDCNIVEHYFPREFHLAPVCEYYDENLSLKCDNGHIGDHTCPSCKGTGKNIHISEQDVVMIGMPEEGTDLPDLSKLIYWHLPPEWLPKYADERLAMLEKSVYWLTFNTQLLDKPTGDATATGEHIDYESIQQKLTPYAKVISDNWRKYVRVSVQYLEAWTDDFVVEHSFPKDHKLQSAGELMKDYGDAKTRGLAYPILEAIEDQILSKKRVDDQMGVALYRAFRNHLPFKDKSESTAARIVSERDKSDFDRLLWENSDKVYRMIIEKHGGNFTAAKMEGQREMIQSILTEIEGKIKYLEDTSVNDPNFN